MPDRNDVDYLLTISARWCRPIVTGIEILPEHEAYQTSKACRTDSVLKANANSRSLLVNKSFHNSIPPITAPAPSHQPGMASPVRCRKELFTMQLSTMLLSHAAHVNDRPDNNSRGGATNGRQEPPHALP